MAYRGIAHLWVVLPPGAPASRRREFGPEDFVEARSQLRAIVEQGLRFRLIDCLFVKRAVFILQDFALAGTGSSFLMN